jgi:hypothetical protein
MSQLIKFVIDHELCGSCAVNHFRASSQCPVDDNTIISVFDNRNLHNLVQIFLREFPGLQPSQVEIEELEATYSPGTTVSFSYF